MASTDAIKFSRRLAQFLANLTEKEIADLVRGSATLQVVRAPSRKTTSRKKGSTTPSQAELQQLLKDLDAASDREAGFQMLDAQLPNKAALEALARLADLPVQRRDTVDNLRQKIVEATIGYRLRSKAVQGEDTEGGSGKYTV